MIHFKYSDALNITYVTLLFGLGMPILFPIAIITLSLQELFEKITIAKVARLPPAMDNQLNDSALNLFSFAPIFLIMNGYWMVDNKAIFDNFWDYRMKAQDNMKSGHLIDVFSFN